MRSVDVCVIGAGPAGSMAAYELATAGWQVVVCEEHAMVGRPVDCSGVIGAEAFERLALPRSSIRDTLTSLSVTSPKGRTFVYEPDRPLAHLVDRAAFDQALVERACEAGAELWMSARVQSLNVEEDRVELVVAGEPPRRLRARAVILAGGPRYQFQRQLGMGSPSKFLKTVQAEVEHEDGGRARIFFGSQIAAGSFAWALPVRDPAQARIKVGISTTADGQAAFKNFIASLKTQGVLNGHAVQPKGWLIPIQPLPRTFADRVLAVGDAAGQTKPTTGGGLYYGLLCARVAGQVLSEHLRSGDVSARKLSIYEHCWRRVLGKELQTSLLFRRIIERLSDEELETLLGLAGHTRLMRLIERRADFDWHRGVILGLWRRPQFARVLLQGLMRSCLPG